MMEYVNKEAFTLCDHYKHFLFPLHFVLWYKKFNFWLSTFYMKHVPVHIFNIGDVLEWFFLIITYVPIHVDSKMSNFQNNLSNIFLGPPDIQKSMQDHIWMNKLWSFTIDVYHNSSKL